MVGVDDAVGVGLEVWVGVCVRVGVSVMVGVGVIVLVGLAVSVKALQVGISRRDVRVAESAVPVMRKSKGNGLDTEIKAHGKRVIKAKITKRILMRKTGITLDNTVQ